VVRQAVRQTYTYYSPEKPTGWVVKDAELEGEGKAWTLGEYHHPVYPSPLNVRVGNAGIKVSTVIGWLRANDNNEQRVLAGYGQVVEPEDIKAALWYYEQNKEAIDQRLAEEEAGAA
jgi:uncharacterized protein (DUF433 family)